MTFSLRSLAMLKRIAKFFYQKPWLFLLALVCLIYYQFIILGKIPLPADTLVGAYYPWLDYKWGYPVGVPVKNPLISDVFSQFYVWKQLIVQIIKSGQIPLWNKYALSGTPLLATFHSAALFPGNLLLFIPKIGWGLYIFASTLFASVSMYLFLGKTKYSQNRLIGSLIFAFAGLMTTWAEFGTAVWAISFLPLSLYCVNRIIVDNKKLYQPILSICIFLICLAGHVQILTYTLIIVPIYILYRLKQANTKRVLNNINSPVIPSVVEGSLHSRVHSVEMTTRSYSTPSTKSIYKKLVITSSFIILGIGLGSPQLLPSFTFEKDSIHQSEYGIINYNYGLTPWYESIRLFAADYFGNPTTKNHFSQNSYHEQSSYLGVLTLPLIFTLFLRKGKSKKPWFFIIAFFTCLFLIYDNPISHFILSQPIPLLTYSSISRLIFVITFLAGTITVYFLDTFNPKKETRIIQLFCFLEIMLIVIGLFFINQKYIQISLRNSLPYLAILVTFMFICQIFSKQKRVFLFITLLLFTFDFGRYFLKYNPFVDRKLIFPNTPIIEYLQKQPGLFRIAREDTNLLPTNTWINYSLESIEGYDPLFSENYARFFHVANNNSYFNTIGRYVKLNRINPNFLSALNVKYVLTLRSSKLIDQLLPAGFKLVYEEGSVQIYENPNYLDRAYFVDELQIAQDKTDFIKTFEAKTFNPTKTALIEDQIDNLKLSQNHGKITQITHLDNSVAINISSSQTEFMILSDSYDPGWKAYLNGEEIKIYRVNNALRGVITPPGDHQLIFRYLPKSFLYGVYIFTFTALTLVIYTLIITKRNRQYEK